MVQNDNQIIEDIPVQERAVNFLIKIQEFIFIKLKMYLDK